MTDPINVGLSPEQVQQMAVAALRTPLPRLYTNGFMVAQTASDLAVILLVNGNPSAVLNMSYISAKSLLVELEKVVTSFEQVTKQTIKTIEELSVELQKAQGVSNVPR